MTPATEARRQAGLELQALAEEFEASDESSFRRTRILCWVSTALVSIVILALLFAGGDTRYLGAFWVAMVGLTWAGYLLSSRRQRQQTARLRTMANRWLTDDAPPVHHL